MATAAGVETEVWPWIVSDSAETGWTRPTSSRSPLTGPILQPVGRGIRLCAMAIGARAKTAAVRR